MGIKTTLLQGAIGSLKGKIVAGTLAVVIAGGAGTGYVVHQNNLESTKSKPVIKQTELQTTTTKDSSATNKQVAEPTTEVKQPQPTQTQVQTQPVQQQKTNTQQTTNVQVQQPKQNTEAVKPVQQTQNTQPTTTVKSNVQTTQPSASTQPTQQASGTSVNGTQGNLAPNVGGSTESYGGNHDNSIQVYHK